VVFHLVEFVPDAFRFAAVIFFEKIFGRAGRPQFDTTGEGTIITTHDKLSRYLALITRQNPIESQFVEFVVDNLNAEVSLKPASNAKDAL